MKYGILVCGLVGIASTFVGDGAPWGMHDAMAPSVYLYLFGFALAVAVAAAKLKKPMLRWHAIVALIGAGLTLMIHRGSFGELVKPVSILGAIGLYGVAICAIGGIAKPEVE